MIGNNKEKKEFAPFCYTLLEKGQGPLKIDHSNSEQKEACPVWDSNQACMDRMPSLQHLCHHDRFEPESSESIDHISTTCATATPHCRLQVVKASLNSLQQLCLKWWIEKSF